MKAGRLQEVSNSFRSTLSVGWGGINHLIWPAVCVNCSAHIEHGDGSLCKGCWEDLLQSCGGDYCCRCGLDASKYAMVNGRCPHCIDKEIHFDAIARCGVYQDSLQRMVLGLKFSDRTEYLSVFCNLIRACFEGSGFKSEIDFLVAVPLHWTRRFARGYNQSALLSRVIKSKNISISKDLVRIRRTKQQLAVTTFKKREANVAGAFAVRKGHPFDGRIVCLVDDIKTSGATLNECAKTLKSAGAKNVYAIVLAVAGQNSR